MKKIGNLVIGGIVQKIFNLVLITALLIAGAYSLVVFYQLRNLTELVNTSGVQQQESIHDLSSKTMNGMIQSSLGRSTQLEAYIADDLFSDLEDQVELLKNYAESLYDGKGIHGSFRVPAPDPANEGKAVVQLLTQEGTDLSRGDIQSKIALLSNMNDMMLSQFENSERLNSCFIGTPDGLFIIADDRSGKKFTADGELNHIPVTERPWYKGAVETGGVYFTGIEKDMFTDEIGIVCAIPVYHNGRIVAVVGADMFLGSMKTAVEETAGQYDQVLIIDRDGHVIFSPFTEGELQVYSSENAPDLRKSDNAELAAFITEAMQGNNSVKVIKLQDKSYYMTAAEMNTVGWTIISVIDSSLADQPTVMMQEKTDEIQQASREIFRNNIRNARNTLIGFLLLIFALSIFNAIVLGKRIVKPLETITKRISSLGGDEKQFRMEDVYRTGDEIETLAQSFADISEKTVAYMNELQTVTAEKERIGAELHLATEIQESQLPRIFPPYPYRPEFELFATMIPAKEVGGDFYDFFLIDDDHLALVMADVSGKGVPAALFMMIAKILIKTRLEAGESPGEVLKNVNNHLLEGNKTGMFVTVWLAVITLSTGEGVAVNAGHEHPIVRRAGGQYEIVKYKHSMAVAAMEDISFREHTFKMNAGDSLFVYTDGVPEAENSSRELLGTERVLAALNKDADASPVQVLENVMCGIDAFVGSAEQFDDITMLSMRYNGGTAGGIHKKMKIEAKKENLDQVLEFIRSSMDEMTDSVKTKLQMELASEEIFVNIANYAYGAETGNVVIHVDMDRTNSQIAVTFIDSGTPYNPLEKADPDMAATAEDRQIGGLGIYMSKKTSDQMFYRYEDKKNILTIKKNL